MSRILIRTIHQNYNCKCKARVYKWGNADSLTLKKEVGVLRGLAHVTGQAFDKSEYHWFLLYASEDFASECSCDEDSCKMMCAPYITASRERIQHLGWILIKRGSIYDNFKTSFSPIKIVYLLTRLLLYWLEKTQNIMYRLEMNVIIIRNVQ